MEILITVYLIGCVFIALIGLLFKIGLKIKWEFKEWVNYMVFVALSWITVLIAIASIILIMVCTKSDMDDPYIDDLGYDGID